jgi:hypothetical protein
LFFSSKEWGLREDVKDDINLSRPNGPNGTNGHDLPEEAGNVPNGPVTEAEAAAPPEEQAPAEPQPRFYNIDLDRMIGRLYKGRYLTPDNMLEDLVRIVKNAELAARVAGEVEQEQRAQAMLINARVMVDQAFDAQFRLDCARMAERQRERMKKAQEKEEERKKEKDGEAGQIPPAHPSTPPPPEDRENALEDERPADATHVDVDLTDRQFGGKRSRTISISGSRQRTPMDVDLQEPPAKRARGLSEVNGSSLTDTGGEDLQWQEQSRTAMDREPHANGIDSFHPQGHVTEASILATDGDFEAGVPSNAIMEGVQGADHPFDHIPDRSDLVSSGTPSGVAVSSASSLPGGGLNAFVSAGQVQPNGIYTTNPLHSEGSQSVAPAALSPPPEPLPPFVINDKAVDSLAVFLRSDTSGLNVEELEQLRAACYDTVWRARREWNRDPLIDELRELAEGFVEEAMQAK